MKCPQIQEKMMDVLYAELLDSRLCFEFFEHLRECRACNQEYMELVETRGMLAEWKVEERFEADRKTLREAASSGPPSAEAARPVRWRQGLTEFRPLLLRAAAVVLMVVGGLTLLQQSGLSIGSEPVVRFTEPELQYYIDRAVDQQLEVERVRMSNKLQVIWEDLRLEQYRQVHNEVEELHSYLKNAVLLPRGTQPDGLKRMDDR